MGYAERPNPGRSAPVPAMRPRLAKRIASSALGLIVLGLVWFYVAPVGLGGSTTYVVTHGVSMEPRFHTGDLAIVRSQSSYHVGEIVAYQSKMLGTVVLHRIIGKTGDRFLFKGDNNHFIDFEHPRANQLVGSLWLHVPGAGADFQSIQSPVLVGVLVAVAILLLTGGVFTQRRRRRRRQGQLAAQTPHQPMRLMHRPAERATGVLTVGLIALFPFVLVALLAFTRPSTARRPSETAYKQSGKLSYSANATPGPTYANNVAETGDPLFTRVVNDVNVRFDYRLDTAAKQALAGTAYLSANVASTSGWHTTLALGGQTHFHGNRATVTATLGLNSLFGLLHRVQETTGMTSGYTLTLVPHVSVHGTIDSKPLHATFAPLVPFTVTPLEVQPVEASASAATAAAKPATSPFTPTASGTVKGSDYKPLYLSLAFARPSVATARRIALGGIALVVLVLLGLLALPRPRRTNESSIIRSRYGRMVVQVERVWQLPGVPVIDVADMDALARIAEHYDRSILHETTDEGEAFWVTDESGQFRYAIGVLAPAVAPEPVYEQAAEEIPLEAEAAAHVQPEELRYEPFASQAHTAEIPLGGLVSVYETRPAPEIVASAPAVEDWAAHSAADAIVREWRAGWDSADTRRGSGTAV
jgi:signal peptidase I